MPEKALIAMSGGVDSSLAAKLMQDAGYSCIGCTMKLLRGREPGPEDGRACCTLEDAEDARSVAFKLGMPFYVFNFTREFERDVIDRFVRCYEEGGTPNPCIDCNRYVKFGRLLQRAEELGCVCMATGHYARIEERGGRYLLKKAADEGKDQSYFLYTLTQTQLARLRFPLGELHKAQVRILAEEYGFLNADKPDSQDICFVPDGDYAAFMEQYTGRTYPAGDFVDLTGKAVGRHRGAVRYTLGQRRGLDLPMGERVYVCAKDMAANTVTVGPDSALYTKKLQADKMNWIAIERLEGPLRVGARTRSTQRAQAATVFPLAEDRVLVEFDVPQRAVTPGQAVVLYDGDVVVGGGVIESAVTGGEEHGPV